MKKIRVTISEGELIQNLYPRSYIRDKLRQAGIPISVLGRKLERGVIYRHDDPETNSIIYTWRDE